MPIELIFLVVVSVLLSSGSQTIRVRYDGSAYPDCSGLNGPAFADSDVDHNSPLCLWG